MKGQVVANFIVDHVIEVDHPISLIQLRSWRLYFDGSVCAKGQGAGCVIVSPSGVDINLSVRLEFACCNTTFYKNKIFVHIGVHIKMHIKL
jgi:hypothetical protein